MFTAFTGSVRPVKSLKSVTFRSTGWLTGSTSCCGGAAWGAFLAQPGSDPARMPKTATITQPRIITTSSGDSSGVRIRPLFYEDLSYLPPLDFTSIRLTQKPILKESYRHVSLRVPGNGTGFASALPTGRRCGQGRAAHSGGGRGGAAGGPRR